MLEVARLCGIVYEGVSTGGSTKTLVDSQNIFKPEEYMNGTIWILSGTYDGACKEIIQSAENTITWNAALAGAIVSGVEYALATRKFSRQQLKQAVNWALRRIEIPAKDDSLAVSNADEYDLPEGVSNVKNIYVATGAGNPYGWLENNNWKEIAGKIVFFYGRQPSDTGKAIRIAYMKKHGALAEDGELDSQINEDLLFWMAAQYLWRQTIGTKGKDDPEAYDFFNEASQNVLNEAASSKTIRIKKSTGHTGF